MTKEEINQLGHAFFDGKTLQWKSKDTGQWLNYSNTNCPDFEDGCEWRIKPDEPKTITICTFIHTGGWVIHAVKDSHICKSHINNEEWTHIKSLDQVVGVE